MPKFVCELKVELENLKDLTLNSSSKWNFQVKCSNCGEIHNEIWVDPNEVSDISGSRGQAHVVMKCKLCERVNTILYEEIEGAAIEEKTSDFVKFGSFDCRGLNIEKWKIMGDFEATSSVSSKMFNEIDLSEEFYDYDDEADATVSITSIETRISQIKESKKGKKK